MNKKKISITSRPHVFSSMWNIGQYKYKQYYTTIEIYTEHVFKSGTGRGAQGRRKRRKVSE
jgi:hypothetical protein